VNDLSTRRRAQPSSASLARSTALFLGVALGSGCSPESIWVEGLPAAGVETEAFRAGDTWVDLLAHTVRTDESSQPPTVELVELGVPAPTETRLEEMQQGREGATLILSDQRRAWLLPLEGRSAFEIDVERGGRVRASYGLHLPAGQELPTGTSIGFGIDFVTGAGTKSITRAVVTPGDQREWLEAASDIPGPGVLRFWAMVRGEVGDELELSAAFGVPTIQLEAKRVPDVIVISVDTLRADRLGCYGYERKTSPNVDRLAASGILFENCLSQAPWTLPSYGSLFTSLYPAEHRAGISEKADIWTKGGVTSDYAKLGQKLIEAAPTLAGELSRAGYRTAGFYFNPYLTPRTGMSRGFDEYAFVRYSANAGVDKALAWLEFNEGLPRFLFLQLIDPHWPYAPPEPFDTQFSPRSVESLENYPWPLASVRNNPQTDKRKALLSDLYDGEIAYTDRELGRLFEYFERPGTLTKPLIVFQSDHGEELWDHGEFEHGHSMHRELLQVPLIISMPGSLAPRRVEEHVRMIDVFPTVMDLLGLGFPASLSGTSLVSMARGQHDGAHLVGFAESILWGRPYAPFDEAKTLVVDGWKFVAGDGDAPPQLYRLADDPDERNNLAGSEPKLVAELYARLLAKYESARRGAEDGEALELSEDEQNQLDGLGYTGEGEPDEERDADASDPSPDETDALLDGTD